MILFVAELENADKFFLSLKSQSVYVLKYSLCSISRFRLFTVPLKINNKKVNT